MTRSRRLALRHERIGELTTGELAYVAGGTRATACDCLSVRIECPRFSYPVRECLRTIDCLIGVTSDC